MEKFEYKNEKLNYKILFYYNKSLINLTINDTKRTGKEKLKFEKIQLIYKDNYFKYIPDFIELVNKIKLGEIIINLEENTSLKNNIEDELSNTSDNKDNIIYLNLKILKKLKEDKEPTIFIMKKIYLLNLEYYLTSGPYNKRISSFPFYSCFKKDEINQENIIEFLDQENILNVYNIDSFRYYNFDKKIFQNITKDKIKVGKKLILEFHFNKILNPFITNLKWTENYINKEIINIKNQVNNYSESIKKYDLIFLYASPIIIQRQEENKDLEYMKEIRIIIDLMKQKRKKFNLLFECAGYDVLSEVLIKKKMKILHISSHGTLDDKGKYSLCLEDLKRSGQVDIIDISKLETLLKINKSKIEQLDLVIVSTCHSEDFGKLFLDCGAKNVIYIYKQTPIFDHTSMQFSRYFYYNLIEGKSIEESFNNAIESLKLDKEIKKPCCCQHWHKKNCKNDCNVKKYLDRKKEEHCPPFDIFKKTCECKFTEYNKHNINCELYKQFKNGNLSKYNIKEYQEIKEEKNENIVQICCCDNSIPHNEIAKLIYKYKEPESNKNICPFKLNGNGKVFIDSKISFHYDTDKNEAIMQRKSEMAQIFKNIKVNNNNLNYTIIYGEKGLLKQDFAESLSVYLSERKIIETYKIFRINSNFDFIYLQNKILNDINPNSKNKHVKIINLEFTDMNESFKLMKNIIDLYCYNYIYNIYNLYFIFLLNTRDIKYEEREYFNKEIINDLENNVDKNIKEDNIIYLGLEKNEAIILLKHYINNILSIYEYEELNKILRENNYLPTKIKFLAETLLDKNPQRKKINLNDINLKDNKSNKFNEDLSLTLYYILLNMPSGLPDCFLQFIFEDYIYIKDKKGLMAKYPENNWNYIKKDKRLEENIKEIGNMKFTYKCLFKILKLYTSILEYFVNKKKEKINYLGGNIHYIYNAYNNSSIWNYNNSINNIEKIFGKKIFNKDYNIESHSMNILNLISLIIENINIFRQIEIISDVLDIYLEKILLLFPSYFFLKRNCLNILKSCINLCDKLIEGSNKDKNKIKLKQKLLLFLYSIKESENEILKLKDVEPELQIEINILKIIRTKKDKRKKLKKLLKDKNIKNNTKGYLNYEIAISYFEEKNYEKCLKNLESILNSNKVNDIFKQRITIDYCSVFKKKFIKEKPKENNEEKNEIIIEEENNEKKNFELILKNAQSLCKIMKKTFIKELYYESYYLKKEIYNLLYYDIVMLNSNPLKNNSNFIKTNYNFNNQYYILNQLKKEITSFIKIKSDILKEENLNLALKDKGEILIIQSDCLTDDGDIVCENEKGESDIVLTSQYFQNLNSKRINYKIIILCFPKSSKLIKLFNQEIDYQYLITFEDFNCDNLNDNIMKNYNKSCIEFIIDFIKLSVNYKNDTAEKIFNSAKEKFTNKILKDIKCDNYIILSKKEKDNLKIAYSKEIPENEIFVNYPLFKLEDVIELSDNNKDNYTEKIHELINHLNNTNNQIFYCHESIKKHYIQICFEVMKYFYRHKTFCELYYIDIIKQGKKFLKSLIRKLNKMWNDEIEELDHIDNDLENDDKNQKKMCFIFIYNCVWNDLIDINIYSLLNCNCSFIIIYDQKDVQDNQLNETNVRETTNENEKSIISSKNNVLGEKKTFMIQYLDQQIISFDSFSISSSLMSQYNENLDEKNIKRDLLNYSIETTKNGNLVNYVIYGTPFTEDESKYIFYKILKCVEELHTNNYCHMDLELGNIMLDESYNPVLVNLGTALEMKETNLSVYDGIVNEYTPPELQQKGNNYNGFKADIYHLGVMLYKLVTGKNPFEDQENHIPLSQDLGMLFSRMISQTPNNRYSLKDIFESDWMKKTSEIFKNKNKDFKNLEEKVKSVFEKKKEAFHQNQIKLNENIDIRLPIDNINYFINVREIEEVYDTDIYNYNIIKIPIGVNQVDLMNLLIKRLESDKEHYDKVVSAQTKYSVSFEIKKKLNDAQFKRKRIKIEIELMKIYNKDEYFFRVNNARNNNIFDLDDFYFNIYNIKKLIDNIITEGIK